MGLFGKKQKKADNVAVEEKIETATAEEAVSTDSDAVQTNLVFHEEWQPSTQEKYVLMFRHQQLPTLKPNQLSISGIRLTRFEEDILVEAFIRNALSRAVEFDMVDLVLLDEEGQPIVKGSFDLSEMGEMPALSCVPWRFFFEEESLLTDTIPEEGWTIAFELKSQAAEHQLDLEPNWKEQLSEAQIEHLQQIVAGLPELKKDEVNFMGLEAALKEDASFAVTVFIRNGSSNAISIEQLPLIVEDADGDRVCQGSFALNDFAVQPNTTKPWTFIFPEPLVHKKNPNLSSWKVYVPNA
ncbi:accessory Sec system S-layer assembly protein [Peribacillus asahii]|uniref:Accessory Sec system S-layer assembly protein n=1 Tax=Peribacillus asahii TaxID=228899 RepID=A0A398B4K8_9BACI|nr:accessory Sec system S-layer assembly protein [Peribacillus asahii]RID84757.1 accessory Sec system S-layer assembly protein [Peribacillus asahii]